MSPVKHSTKISSIAKTKTGIQGLDTILYGGLPTGRTTLLSGGPGTGKTVLAMEILYRGALAGEPGVLFSFEEQSEEMRANAAAMGMDIATLEEAGKLKVLHADVPHGAIQSGEFNINGLLAIIEGQTRAIGARRIVMDALDVLMRIFDDPRREREEMYLLNDWLRQRGMTVFLTVKANPAGEQIYPFLDFMADCVLSLDQRMQGQVRTRRLNVLKYRGSDFMGNEHPYVLSSSGVVLMPVSSITLDYPSPGGLASSGNDELDAVLGGGFRRGTCIMLAGASGTGKTTLACTMVRSACAQGGKALFVSFEESPAALREGMLSAGIDLKPLLEKGSLRILSSMPESAGVEHHLLNIFDTIEAFAPEHVIIDAISACRRMGSEIAAFDFLIRMLTSCRERGVTCFFINQIAEPEQAIEISGFGISSLVDTLLVLRFVDDGRRITRRLLVIKSRGAKHSMKYHGFSINGDGLKLDIQANAGGAGK